MDLKLKADSLSFYSCTNLWLFHKSKIYSGQLQNPNLWGALNSLSHDVFFERTQYQNRLFALILLAAMVRKHNRRYANKSQRQKCEKETTILFHLFPSKPFKAFILIELSRNTEEEVWQWPLRNSCITEKECIICYSPSLCS